MKVSPNSELHKQAAHQACADARQRQAAVSRRQMTVAFCDLVGSTELARRVDPEDMLEVLSAFRALVREVAARFGGHVASFVGDGVDIYFGYPVAGEDDAVRALHASLEIAKRVDSLPPDVTAGHELRVRVGIATGMIAISGDETLSIAGETPHLAARIQALAAPGQVVVAPHTRRIAGEQFRYEDLGCSVLKGFDQPIRLSAVIAASALDSRSAWRGRDAQAPLLGRETELATVLNALRDDHCSGALIVAEPGIGKSHLASVAARQLAREGATVLRLQCSPFEVNSVLEPFVQHLRQAAAWLPTDSMETRQQKFRARLAAADLNEPMDASALAALVERTASVDPAFVALLPPARAHVTQIALLRYLVGLARTSRPSGEPGCALPRLLLLIEDLHWADPTSLQLIKLLVRQSNEPLALLMTARTTLEDSDLGATMPIVALGGVDDDAARQIVLRVAGETPLAANVVEAIVEQTDGVPLFIEEMTRMFADTRVFRSEATIARSVPGSLMDLLMERLDRLVAGKWLAQAASVIGHGFGRGLLRDVSELSREAFDKCLSELLDAGLLLPLDGSGERFEFRHALVQDTAYLSLTGRVRERLHGRVAELLLADDERSVEKQPPERVARHLTLGNRVMQASRYWLLAGRRAIDHGAPREAAAHLKAGIQALTRAPAGPERSGAELRLLSMLGPTTMVLEGPGSTAFRDVQERALTLCQELPGAPGQFPVMYGLCLYHWGRSELTRAHELANGLMRACERRPDEPEAIMAANTMSGMVHLSQGDVTAACVHLQRAVACHEPARDAALYPIYLMNFGVFGRFYLAVATFIAGDAEQAERHVDDACELAAGLDQPHTLCFSMAARCTLALLREDARSASEAGARCAEFAGRMGFLEFVGLARIVSGWAIGRSGSLIEGLAELDEGVRLWKATGFENWQAYFGLLRAEILERLGRRTHALHELAVHLARIESSGELLFQSLLLALRASILARGSPDAGASAQLFEAAAGVAKRQAALAWSRRIDKMDAACAVHKASAFAPHP